MAIGWKTRFTYLFAFVVIFFGTTKVAISFAEARQSGMLRNLQVSDFFMPKALGFVTDRHPIISSPKAPVVINIQESHINYEGQKNLAAIIERLVEQYGLKLIMVEGGEGDMSLAHLRTFGSQEVRKSIAEQYLRAGIVSGEEYLDIVSDHQLILWGVEDTALYDKHVKAYRNHDDLRAAVKPALIALGEAVDILKPNLVGSEQAEFTENADSFANETLGLADYVKFLVDSMTKEDLARIGSVYPNLDRFRSLEGVENTFNLTQIPREQAMLVNELKILARSEQEMKALMILAGELKEGKIGRLEFYSVMGQLADAYKFHHGDFPNLFLYIHYLTKKAELDPIELIDEIDKLKISLQSQLKSTQGGRQLLAIADKLDLLEKLADIRLSSQDYERLSQLDVDELLTNWASFFNKQFDLHGISRDIIPSLDKIAVNVPNLINYYELAIQRDAAMVNRALAKLQETREPLAVMITGGFHTQRITEQLTAGKVAVVVITPKVSQATNEKLYRAVLNYKNGTGSLSEVMEISKLESSEE